MFNLTMEEKKMACKYSAYIVCAAAIIIGMKFFDKDLVSDMLGTPRPVMLTQGEKFAYGLLLASGVVCVLCQYYGTQNYFA